MALFDRSGSQHQQNAPDRRAASPRGAEPDRGCAGERPGDRRAQELDHRRKPCAPCRGGHCASDGLGLAVEDPAIFDSKHRPNPRPSRPVCGIFRAWWCWRGEQRRRRLPPLHCRLAVRPAASFRPVQQRLVRHATNGQAGLLLLSRSPIHRSQRTRPQPRPRAVRLSSTRARAAAPAPFKNCPQGRAASELARLRHAPQQAHQRQRQQQRRRKRRRRRRLRGREWGSGDCFLQRQPLRQQPRPGAVVRSAPAPLSRLSLGYLRPCHRDWRCHRRPQRRGRGQR